nr:hypothetical protein [Haloarcula quadrata]
MSHEDFVDYWQANHTPDCQKDIEGVVRYQQVLPTKPSTRRSLTELAEL